MARARFACTYEALYHVQWQWWVVKKYPWSEQHSSPRNFFPSLPRRHYANSPRARVSQKNLLNGKMPAEGRMLLRGVAQKARGKSQLMLGLYPRAATHITLAKMALQQRLVAYSKRNSDPSFKFKIG